VGVDNFSGVSPRSGFPALAGVVITGRTEAEEIVKPCVSMFRCKL
jgi:hypothetical protein